MNMEEHFFCPTISLIFSNVKPATYFIECYQHTLLIHLMMVIMVFITRWDSGAWTLEEAAEIFCLCGPSVSTSVESFCSSSV